MKFLKCKLCKGQLELLDNKGIVRRVCCKKCDFNNIENQKEPEIFVIRKRKN